MATTYSSIEIFTYESFKTQVIMLSEYLKKLEGAEFERCCIFLENTLKPHLEKGKEAQHKINNCNGLEHQISYLSDTEKQLTINGAHIHNFDNDHSFTDKLLNGVGDYTFLPDSLLVNNSILDERNPKENCQALDKSLQTSAYLKFNQGNSSISSDTTKYEINFKENNSLNFINVTNKTNADINLETPNHKPLTPVQSCGEENFENRSDLILNLCSKNKINLKYGSNKLFKSESNNITEDFDALSYHITDSNILLEDRLLDKNDSNSSISDITSYNSKLNSNFNENIGLTKIFAPSLINNSIMQDPKETKKNFNKIDSAAYASDVEVALSLNSSSPKSCFKVNNSEDSTYNNKSVNSETDMDNGVDGILNLKKESTSVTKDMYTKSSSPLDPSSLNLNIYSLINSFDSNAKACDSNITQEEKKNEYDDKALNLVNRKSKVKDLPDKSSKKQSNSGDGKAKQVKKLNKATEKREGGIPRSSKFINHNPVSCHKCRMTFPDVSLWEEHRKSCGKDLYCSHCQTSFKSKVIYFNHLASHKRNTCPHCSETFSSNQLLKNHMKVFHGITLVSKTFPCQYCPRVFMKRGSIYYHLQTHALPNQKVCPKCGTFIDGEEAFKEHMADHIKNAPLRCRLCDAIFDRVQQYKDHMEGHKKNVCAYCKNYTSFSSKKLLFKHYKTEHPDLPSKIDLNDKKYSCDQCPRVFARPSLLEDHKLTHTDNKQLECRICKIKYATRCNLKKHMRKVHTAVENDGNKNRFPCQECGFMYSSVNLLNKHCLNVHNLPVNHICSYCDYKTKTKHLLKRHLRSHIGKKNYLCDICGSMFHSATTLKHHTLFLHSNERSFKCKLCDKSFKKKSCLSRHVRTHSAERPYKCECGSCYKQLSHLSRHISSAHNKKSTHRVKKLITDESKSESDVEDLVDSCRIVAGSASTVSTETERSPSNDILLASSNAVLMPEGTVTQDNSPIFTVMDSQLIQLIPSTLQLNQDGVQAVSLLNGELHTFSLAPPAYQLCQGESFSTTSTDPIIIHSSNSETTSSLGLDDIQGTVNSNTNAFTDGKISLDHMKTNEASQLTLDGQSLTFGTNSLHDFQYRENVVDASESIPSLSTSHYLSSQESPLNQEISNNSIPIF